jgi:exodeoxyribonuclease VII small subunit
VKKPAVPPPVASLDFEQALEELDALVRAMESGAMGLDDSIAAYRRGAELARHCQERLGAAEREIRRLDGETLRPLDEGDLRGAES